ncbi:MAG: hypothetical protein KC731_34355, partial [Myxococcales bacterium]|nr:hypothetical protein [Myxococcales bacterium]
DLMREMQRVAPAMRRILLTGYPGLSDAEDACRNGLCERIMAKPWRKAELLAYLTESQPHG